MNKPRVLRGFCCDRGQRIDVGQSVLEHRVDVAVRTHDFSSLKESEFDEDGDADDVASHSFDEFAGGGHGSAGGEEIVDHKDALPGLYGVGVYFEPA